METNAVDTAGKMKEEDGDESMDHSEGDDEDKLSSDNTEKYYKEYALEYLFATGLNEMADGNKIRHYPQLQELQKEIMDGMEEFVMKDMESDRIGQRESASIIFHAFITLFYHLRNVNVYRIRITCVTSPSPFTSRESV